MSDELPEGWAVSRLVNAVALLQNGPFGSLLHRADYVSGGVPLINPANIVAGQLKPDPEITVGPDVLKRLDSYVMRPGDVVVGRRGEMGRAALVSSELDQWFCGTGCAFLRPGEALDASFLALWFGSPDVRQRLETDSVGATMNNLSTRILGNLDIGVPPLAEQRRIVEKVEALLAHVNAARDRLARVRLILKRFRHAVLALACSGRLTDDWREDRPNSSRRDADGVPGHWKTVSLHQLASAEPRSIQSGPFGSNLKHSEFGASGRLVIGIDNVGDGRFLPGRQNRISQAKFMELEKYAARPLDVLITVMATVGRCCVVPEDIEPSIITKHVYRITTDRKIVLPRFLLAVLRGSPELRGEVAEQIRGQTRPGINGEILKALTVPLPPLEEQGQIVRRVEALFALADIIEKRVAAATARAEKLPQAILSKAFSGELVPTEAELARAERRSFESAVELLARVQADRSDAPGATKRRRSTSKGATVAEPKQKNRRLRATARAR